MPVGESAIRRTGWRVDGRDEADGRGRADGLTSDRDIERERLLYTLASWVMMICEVREMTATGAQAIRRARDTASPGVDGLHRRRCTVARTDIMYSCSIADVVVVA